MKLTLLTALLLAPLATLHAAGTPKPVGKPNILFILTDDQNPGTLRCFGGEVLTPTLDKLCRDGVKFIRVDLQKQINSKTLGRPAYHMDTAQSLQGLVVKDHPGYWDADQLYDLRADHGERVNLPKDPRHAQTVAELKSQLRAWLAGFNRPFGECTP